MLPKLRRSPPVTDASKGLSPERVGHIDPCNQQFGQVALVLPGSGPTHKMRRHVCPNYPKGRLSGPARRPGGSAWLIGVPIPVLRCTHGALFTPSPAALGVRATWSTPDAIGRPPSGRSPSSIQRTPLRHNAVALISISRTHRDIPRDRSGYRGTSRAQRARSGRLTRWNLCR